MDNEKDETLKKLSILIEQYNNYKREGKTDNSSEETVRNWIDDLLYIFGWDVKNTFEVIQSKKLSQNEIEKLQGINSSHDFPDYTLKQGRRILSFIDAKAFSVKLNKFKKGAFQIRSYGWSADLPCAILTNFEELCIYDCRYTPEINQSANFARAYYFTINDYLSNFDTLYDHLNRKQVTNGKLESIYSKDKTTKGLEPLDSLFARHLSDFRSLLAQHILENNAEIIGKDSRKLSYIVQVILDRIIFIRVCEARYLEKDGLLLDFVTMGFWSKFTKSSYNEFYEHYDGPLFERVDLLNSIKIKDHVFSDFIKKLYFPGPYRFDVIPIKLLADVYEQFLVKRLNISNGKVIEEFKLEYQKSHAAISTPKYIVDYICKEATKEFASSHELMELYDKKVLDPACGSGTFLISAFELLEKRCLELIKDEKDTDLFYKEGSNYYLTITSKRNLVEKVLFGIDFDPEAVEVTKMSLALKVIDNNGEPTSYQNIGLYGSKILRGIGDNIVLGNTLVETDIYKMQQNLMDDREQTLLIRPYDIRNGKFSEIFDKNGGFDIIVGNPPYVEPKYFKKEVPEMHMYISSKYSTYSGKTDLAVIFLERCYSLLSDSGVLGFIVQRRFFGTNYGIKIRRFLSSSKSVMGIVGFKTNKIFRRKITYVAILFLSRKPNSHFWYLDVKGEPELIEPLFSQNSFDNIQNFEPRQYPYNKLEGDIWSFESDAVDNLSEELKSKHKTLRDFPGLSVEGGIQVLWKSLYHIIPEEIKDGIISGRNAFGEQVEVEEAACRPVIYNEFIYCFKDLPINAYAIFPYEEKDPSREILFSQFKRRYPLAGAYLEARKKKITENVEVIKVKVGENFEPDSERWHLFTRKLNHESFNLKKIILPMTARDTFASLKLEGHCYLDNSNLWAVSIEQDDETILTAIAAIFNSTLFSVMATTRANPQSGGYKKLNRQFLDPVPFPSKQILEDRDSVLDLYNTSHRIIDLQKRYLMAAPPDRISVADSLKFLWRELDIKVEKLYGLNEHQSEIINSVGRNESRIEILKAGKDEF